MNPCDSPNNAQASLGPQFAAAQAAYDAQQPPEDWNCREDGHRYRRTGSETKDGDAEVRCTVCGRREIV